LFFRTFRVTIYHKAAYNLPRFVIIDFVVEKKYLDLSVIIPFHNKAKMTSDAILTFVKYGPEINEFVLISNNSSEEEIEKLSSLIQHIKNARIVTYDKPFNYQKICNWGASQSKSNYLLFLNNDTELKEQSRGLIERMYQKATQPNVGMVGCLLLYGDEKTIQHAGVFLKPGLQADHLYVGQIYKKILESKDIDKYPYDLLQDRQLTAVTGAVQLIEKSKFDEVKGFDERFIICGGDVDLCIRLNKASFQTWYLGGGYIVHKESQSRAYKPVPYIDFYYSYKSYINGYDLNVGDPFLPKITEGMS
jgi:GT2 family glycosyltransferase